MSEKTTLECTEPVAPSERTQALTRVRRFVAAPVFAGDDERTRLANLLNAVLMIVLMAAALGSAAATVVEPTDTSSVNVVF